MKLLCLLALVAGAAAADNFTLTSPPSRGFDANQAQFGPCGGFNQATNFTTVKNQDTFKFTVPGSQQGIIGVFFLPNGDNSTSWTPVANVTVSGNDTTVSSTVNFEKAVTTASNGTVQATFFRTDLSLQDKPLFQCADVHVSAPEKKEATTDSSSASAMQLTLSATALSVIVALMHL
ncbi:hypothetical protein BJ085DRAFT_27422 [Dimargaris cristalligena]|uniref:Copper acquisition factor BIM1-like domain-containing protein n=1 Tax=Dimargaris cristalligena TaxID=215637 RepID=A0A4Q0A105_9FUNG|nr:hypothetical protein BJ085DRAFT_27422 [Dimargaris cristalligena]|eukprot:RKP39418.1 hypothetical protein BJ085DRAFT_27422 [Dimargaris cristalligena]